MMGLGGSGCVQVSVTEIDADSSSLGKRDT